ncbi:MAG: hypothetical protein HXY35_10030 [Chloroflexi bacterium]|nr:hypothetical protein [Chloroflexota bacterium]
MRLMRGEGYLGSAEVAIDRDFQEGGKPREMLLRIKNGAGTKALPQVLRLEALQLRDDPSINYGGGGARLRNDVVYFPAPAPEIEGEAVFVPGAEVEPVSGEEFTCYRDFMLKLFYEYNKREIDPNWGVGDFEGFLKMYQEAGEKIPARPGVWLGWFDVHSAFYNQTIELEIKYGNLPMDKPLAVGAPVFVITDGSQSAHPGVVDLVYPRISGPLVKEDERSVTVGAPIVELGEERVLQAMVAWNNTDYNLLMWRYREGDAPHIAEQANMRAREFLLVSYAMLFPAEVARVKEIWRDPYLAKR